MQKIKVWRESPEAKLPTKGTPGSACYDLYSTEEKTIQPNSYEYIANGIRVIVPDGYYIRFNTRSSLGFIKDLFVYPGVLDASFTGNLDVKIYNFGTEPITITKGQRYTQFELLKLRKSEIEEIDYETFEEIESQAERGSKGCWGSTGTH